jgi:transposase
MDLYFHKGVGATPIIRQIPISRSMLYRWIAKFAEANGLKESTDKPWGKRGAKIKKKIAKFVILRNLAIFLDDSYRVLCIVMHRICIILHAPNLFRRALLPSNAI